MQGLDPGEQWDALVADWQVKHNAVQSFPLFERGWMQLDRSAEFEKLRGAEREARRKMNAFIAANT
ncbi:MAG: hypothetical protein JO001_06625 [Alphaproteobacteria bacterium]|nr:hypothetical protein [Alphaproteobacteria bacterium]